MENPIKMDDLGGKPTIFGNIHITPFVSHAMTMWKGPNPSPRFLRDENRSNDHTKSLNSEWSSKHR